MNSSPTEIIRLMYNLLDDNSKRALRSTAYCYLQMLPSPTITLTVDMDDLEELTHDVEAFKVAGAGRLKSHGYAGIREIGVDGDYMAKGLDWAQICRAMQFVQPKEIAIYGFQLQISGSWDRVTQLIGSECEALTLIAVSGGSDSYFFCITEAAIAYTCRIPR
jgi:hypothetical protein